MKIKVTHNSVELKLTLEDLDSLRGIITVAECKTVDEVSKRKANTLNKKLRDAKEAANKLNWMDGI